MDLKQEVSLSALKRGKAPAYPVKTSINLVDTQQQRGNLLAQLGLFAIALVLIGIFTKVMGVGHLSSLRMEKNTATVTCLGADLNEVSALVESLESDQRVAHVTVSTAQGENDSSTSATIQIVFAGPLDVEGDGGSKEKGAGDGAA